MTMGVAKIARRTFLVGAAALAGGLAVGYWYVRKPHPNPLIGELAEGEVTFNPFVKIAADNTITVIAPRAEMGQGIATTLAALVAEELDVPLDKLKVEHGPAGWAYYNGAMLEDAGPYPSFDEGMVAEAMRATMPSVGKVFGLQITGGSSSTRDGYVKMREAGAAARQVLVAAAAARWNVPESGLRTADASVSDPASGRSATYGELAADAAKLAPETAAALKPKSEWKVLGKSQPRVDMQAKVTGAPIFGIDVELPEMLYATVKLSPRFGAKALSHSDDETMKVPGVIKVVAIETPAGSGFGIIAQNTWAAFKGAEALSVDWDEAPYPADSEALFASLAETLGKPASFTLRDDGDVDAAFAGAPAGELVEADYGVPWLAHACMEPMNATAQLRDGVLDIWAPNQAPTAIQMTAASLLGIGTEAIRVHTTYLGGGFGRRGEMDFALYAALIARETDGRPVKVTWTREEDMRHDMYRPAALCRARARIVRGEGPSALDMRIASPSIIRSFLARTFPSIPAGGLDKTVTEGAHDQPVKIANYRVSGHVSDLAIPVGFWRSVGNSYNGFFHESFLDEVAHASGVDPLDMRLKLMADYPAATGVLKRAAEMAGWGYKLAEGRGMGIAHTLSFGTWVAQVIQVRDGEDGIRIEKVWCAADIGQALDPGIVRAQMMSGIVFGLSSAMGQEITFANGEVEQSNFHDYDAMRMNQCPEIEVAILENNHRMGGAGEPGTPPSIPALANAIFAATGKRIRKLPLSGEVDFA